VITSPPKEIDGATVLIVADLAASTETGRTRHNIGNEQAGGFAALAIAKYRSDPGYYLFYCDETWKVVTDTYHETLEAAVGQIRFEFTGVVLTDPDGVAGLESQ